MSVIDRRQEGLKGHSKTGPSLEGFCFLEKYNERKRNILVVIYTLGWLSGA